MERLQQGLQILLVLVGVSEGLGYLAELEAVRYAGRSTSASVLPLVFNEVGGIEFWANAYSLELHYADGETAFFELTAEIREQIAGPHTRAAAYVVPLGLSPIAGRWLYEPPLRHGVCGGPIARALTLDRDVESFTVHVTTRQRQRPQTWRREVQCPR